MTEQYIESLERVKHLSDVSPGLTRDVREQRREGDRDRVLELDNERRISVESIPTGRVRVHSQSP